MIKTLFSENFFIKAAKFFLIAFALNSLLLLGLNFGDTWELFSSTLHFSMTILPAGSGSPPPLAPPTNENPANGSNALLPLVCNVGGISIADAQIKKIQWVFRKSDIPDYAPPLFLAEIIGNNKIFNAPDGIFAVGETYYWKARYMNMQNTWSAYSDETGFTVVAPPVVATPITSSGGYTGGYGGYSSGSGGSVPPPLPPPSLPSSSQQQPILKPSASQTPIPTTKTPAVKTPQKTAPIKQQPVKSPTKLEPQKKSSNPPGGNTQKPSVQEMPVNIKLKKNKIPEKQPLKIEISPVKSKQPAAKPTPSKPAVKPAPKPGAVKPQMNLMQRIIDQIKNNPTSKTIKETMNLDIQIRNSSGESVLRKQEEIKIDETETEKNLEDTSALPAGNYVVSFSYEKDGTIFAVSDNLEITPRTPFQKFAATVLLWNEGLLPILFISSLAVLFFKRGLKKRRS